MRVHEEYDHATHDMVSGLKRRDENDGGELGAQLILGVLWVEYDVMTAWQQDRRRSRRRLFLLCGEGGGCG